MGNLLNKSEEDKFDEGIGKGERRVRDADLGHNNNHAQFQAQDQNL
jgi:hypothetical protein